MLYLEDYLELIEHLPLELRDRFTDIRERDLQVHNSTEQLREKVKLFFAEAKKLKPEQRQCDYEKLINEFQETMKYADDKVHISTQMHDIMIKLIQRLDTELEKFKLELEADHAGITEELEKRSLELDADSRLDDIINNHHASASTTSKVVSCIKDRRRSEHKNRHHPYQNNHDNGYQGRAKLSHHEHNPSKNHLHYNNNHHHHQRQGSKSSQNVGSSRQQASVSPNQLIAGYSTSNGAQAPIAAGFESNGRETAGGHYGNNLTSFGNNPGFNNSSIYKNNNSITANLPFSQQHSALSAALASNTTTGHQLNSVSALAMMNATSVQNKISNNFKGNELSDPNSPLVRQNPLAAAATQAIAATQQLQQGRRTPSLKASFAAINAAGLGGPLDSLGIKQQHDALIANNRNALAPMAPDQQAFSRYNQQQQFGKLAANGNGNSSPLYISVTKSGRPTKRPRHHASHLYPDESPTSISSDNSVFENSESLSSTDFIEGTTFGSASPSSLDFSTNAAQGNTTLYHRDETKYCICRQISYGEMVACDNDECEIEWFHYDCVGVTSPPKGDWFCPDCKHKMTGHHHQQQQHHSNPQTQKKRGRKEKSLFNLVNTSIDTVRSNDMGSEQSRSIV